MARPPSLNAIAQALRATLDSTDGSTIQYSLRNGADSAAVILEGVHRGRARRADLNVVTRPDGRVVAIAEGGLLDSAEPPLPIACLVPDRRFASDKTPGVTEPGEWGPYLTYAGAFEATADFEQMFRWFREREDVENEIRRRERSLTDPQLDAVRTAVERVLEDEAGGSSASVRPA